MSKLLYLAHRIPFPPNKGDKIRSFHTLKHLAKTHRIYLGAFVDDENDWQYGDDLKGLCEDIFLCPLRPVQARLRSIKGLLKHEPLTLSYYDDNNMRKWIKRTIRENDIDKTYVFSSSMAQYIEGANLTMATNVADLVDVDSDKWRQYALSKRWPMNWLYNREADYLQQYESKIANLFDAIIFVSDHEASFFKKIAPQCREKIGWINNGVDCNYFSPDRDYPQLYESEKKIIVFTGAMDYWANVDAVNWFVNEVFNGVHSVLPECQFFIVGAKPGTAVQQLSNIPGVVVTGAVPDVRPYLAHAAMAVAPLRIARGVQNKVLESMAMGLPVIASSAAVDGILPVTRNLITVCDDPHKMQQQVVKTLQGNMDHRMKRAVRDSVLNEYSWDKNLSELDEYYSS